MRAIRSEDDFQLWIKLLLEQEGHVHDHRFSFLPHVPDLSAAGHGMDYWLELKYDRFRLGHDRYDDFRWSKESAGQVDWLHKRALHGKAICGILGYLDTGENVQFVSFMSSEAYRAWRGVNVGAVLLTDYCTPAQKISNGRDLLSLLERAARCTSRPG